MSAPRPLQQQLLESVEARIDEITSVLRGKNRRFEGRLQLLEAVSSRLGTFALDGYFKHFNIVPLFTLPQLDRAAAEVLELLSHVPVHPALALSALAREPLLSQAQREAGAYYTDFRLAQHVGNTAAHLYKEGMPVIDPACGTGVLLCALTLAICGHDRRKAARWLATMVHAADRSAAALRGACLALASFTDDLNAVVKMRQNWFLGDSLTRPSSEWLRVAPKGYGAIVANPPWEKVKLSRHEHAQRKGRRGHYGAQEHFVDSGEHALERQKTAQYARIVAARFPLAANGELDLYAAFCELMSELAAPGGATVALVPAGLIRSQGTESLRKKLLADMVSLEVVVFDNRARFFAIDTRFKFLCVAGRVADEQQAGGVKSIALSFGSATDAACTVTKPTAIAVSVLRSLRPDYTLPEVRSAAEWRLFSKASRNGVPWSVDTEEWRPDFRREVDMTRERQHFETASSRVKSDLPLVEGRMVQSHRFGAKAYSDGTGRRAIWKALPPGSSTVAPQFWVAGEHLPSDTFVRTLFRRAGFCDIAGQTNERSMMAAVIPEGVVCGNKVPTVQFSGVPGDDERLYLWVGLVNSIAFDWLLRRVLTTTVNYFLLRSVPLPALSLHSLPGREVIKCSTRLAALDTNGTTTQEALWEMARLRSRIDVLALVGYGGTFADLQLMLQDFPLLDRGQPPIEGEARSTITKDYLLAEASRRFRRNPKPHEERVNAAKKQGAIPYIPSEFTVPEDDAQLIRRAART